MADHKSSLIEIIGLDWIPILLGFSTFKEGTTPYYIDRTQVTQKFSGISKDNLNYGLQQCEGLIKKEDERGEKIEGKAFTLIGITGITTGILAGIQPLLFEREKLPDIGVLVIVATLFVLIVLALIITIYLVTKVVNVGDYVFTYPSANDVFALANNNLEDVKHERIIDLYTSFVKNHQVINRKATYLGGAQKWFRNSLVLTLILTLVFAFSALLGGNSTSMLPPTPATISSPTAISIITPQATINPILNSPIWTVSATFSNTPIPSIHPTSTFPPP